MALDHFISQVHLKQFYSPVLGELMYAIRKSDLKKFTPNSKAVCRIDEGSTNEYLTDPRAIEEFLKTVEGKYNKAVSRLETEKPDLESIYVIAGFVSYVMTCSPAAMRINSGPMEGSLVATAKHEEKNKVFPVEKPPPELGGKSLAELLESGKIKFEIDPKYPQAVGISNIFQRVTAFGNFHWDILINENEDCPFFTSDYPIGTEPSNDHRAQNRIVPLNPTTAIRIQPDIKFDRNKANFEFGYFSSSRRKLRRQEAIKINRLLVQSADDVVFFRDDQKWVEGFIKKNRHFRVETKSIEIQKPNGTLIWSRQVTVPFEHG